MQVTLTLSDVSELLRLWVMRGGAASRSLAKTVSDMLPGKMSVAYSTVQRYMRGEFPAAGPDPLLLAAITQALGHELAELPPECQETIAQARSLLGCAPAGNDVPAPRRRSGNAPIRNRRSAKIS